jgi:hypothetical protein
VHRLERRADRVKRPARPFAVAAAFKRRHRAPAVALGALERAGFLRVSRAASRAVSSTGPDSSCFF